LKVTVPVAPVVTVAVKVTAWLGADGFADEMSVTVGVVLPTVTIVAGEVAGLLFASPGVLAVIGWLPIPSEGTVSVAVPFTIGAVPRTVLPSEKVTGPETPGGTCSVIVTGVPGAGFALETVGGGNVGVFLLTVIVVLPVAGLLFVSPL
jgi:hypothetical protein